MIDISKLLTLKHHFPKTLYGDYKCPFRDTYGVPRCPRWPGMSSKVCQTCFPFITNSLSGSKTKLFINPFRNPLCTVIGSNAVMKCKKCGPFLYQYSKDWNIVPSFPSSGRRKGKCNLSCMIISPKAEAGHFVPALARESIPDWNWIRA